MKKYKIYDYSGCAKFRKLINTDILNNFEVIENQNYSVQEIVDQHFDVIETGGQSYEDFKNHLGLIDWKINQIAMADCLVLQKNNLYKPYNVLADAVFRVLKENPEKIDSQKPVIIVGDYYFSFTMALKLASSGFVEIVVSLIAEDAQKEEIFTTNLQKISFDLNVKMIPINDLTTTEQAGFLLITKFRKEQNPEAYDLLAYFNFLSEGAVFVDCNSLTDSYLVDDARRAEIFVIDESAILSNKYGYLLEILKNSP